MSKIRIRPSRARLAGVVAAAVATALIAGCTAGSTNTAAPPRTAGTVSTASSAGPARSAAPSSASASSAVGGPLGAAAGLGATASTKGAAGRISGSSCTSTAVGVTVGADPIAKLIIKSTLHKVGDAAFDWGVDEGLGWALDLIVNPESQTDKKLDDIKSTLDDVQQNLSDLKVEVGDLSQQVTELQNEMKSEFEKVDFTVVATSANRDLGPIGGWLQSYDGIISDSKNTPGYKLTPEQITSLVTMRNQIPNLIKQIDNDVVAAGDAHQDLFTLWNKVAWQQVTGTDTGPVDNIYPAAYLDQAYNLVDYYSAQVVRALQLYADAMHLDFTDNNGTHYPPESDAVCAEYKIVDTMLDKWSNLSAKGIGRIPDGTFVDLRNADAPLLLTDGPIQPTGGTGQYYCGRGESYCYADFYDQNGRVIDQTLVRDVKLTEDHISDLGGWTDWRIPRPADLDALQQGVTGGLTDWGSMHQVKIFTPDPITSHTYNAGQKIATIPPILVDLDTPGSGDKTYDRYTANPSDNTFTKLARPADADSGAGRVIAVRNFVPETAGGGMPGPAEQLAVQGPAAAPASSFTPAGDPKTFATPGGRCTTNTYPVPAGVTAVKVEVVGGAGGTGYVDGNPDHGHSAGGKAGLVTGIIPVVPGNTLYVQVGANGGTGLGGSDFNGGAGAGGRNSGSGGVASGISTDKDCTRWLVMAGGGGGGGGGIYYRAPLGTPYGTAGGTGGDAAPTGRAATDGNTLKGGHSCGLAGQQYPSYHSGAGGPGATPGQDSWFLRGGQGGSGGGDGSYDTPPNAGGGGGGGFWFGGAGGGGGSGKCAGDGGGGGGGAGGASYLTDTTAFGIDDTTGKLDTTTAAPHVTLTPLSGTPVTNPTLTTTGNHINAGDNLTLTATVNPQAKGTITFTDDQQGPLGTAALSGGTAALTTSRLTPGTHHITAHYNGYGPWAPGDSDPVSITVTAEQPRMQIGVNPITIKHGQPFKITITMPANATGTLGFYDADQPGPDYGIGTAPIVNGSAVLTQPSKELAVGTHRLSASFGGDSLYLPNDTTQTVLTVTN